MTYFEETRRILCHDGKGRTIVVIEQRKLPRASRPDQSAEPIFDYMTDDGQVANKLDDDSFLMLLTDEVFRSSPEPQTAAN